MPKFIITIPNGKYEVEAESKAEALAVGFTDYIRELAELIDGGGLIENPDIIREKKKKGGVENEPQNQ